MEATLSHSLLYVHNVPVLQGNQSMCEELGWQGDREAGKLPDCTLQHAACRHDLALSSIPMRTHSW